ncbi:acyl-CoA dehydrogenase family protein [Actinomadura rudentiformis]|uniref:Acyl-[acyl-carrier-protein] dehydrogenase MbtN n=1 Tax=Actinomadura rudentiformis TaxID=359158 RepID=A0A6H9YTM0_9ACTN|nr:acyl-CoA dehydrogenase family protein [Actinomadura rudentiformis]KAB2344532.1 acyl-CoA dehydrogenase [Actinomadura rudentiformis]
MRRTVFDDDHEVFRATVRDVLAREVVPVFPEWEKAGAAPRGFYRLLGKLGVLGVRVPEEYGGGGQSSFKFNAVVNEEMARAKLGLGTVRVHTDIVLPYLLRYTDDEQKRRWLPGVADGGLMTAIAMTEPGTGSDLAGITTTATRDGDHWILNGAKTFITGAVNADLVLVVARTSVSPGNRRAGLSILVVDTSSPGFSVGRNLAKIGLKAQDTAELAFDDVRVPAENLLGEEGRAFEYLGHNLAQERLSIAVNAQAAAAAAVDLTLAYVTERNVFGKPLSGFQNTKFVLAECAAEVEAGQAMVDRALEEHDAGGLSVADAAKVKLFCTELQSRVVDKCLQLHGGYGYVLEYPIARMYADARVTRIFGGTSEVMKSIIAKSIGL